MKPVNEELFNRTAPGWNCVDFPRDGMHYLGGVNGCRWCGMTAQQVSAEREEISARWDRERELGIKSKMMNPYEIAKGTYVCVPPMRWIDRGGCFRSPHITIRSQGVWIESDRPDTLTGRHLWTSAHRDCYERWLADEGNAS